MSEALAMLEADARAAYSEPSRHYHDQRHLDLCLAAAAAAPLTAQERQMLRWAFLWHDAVYDPARSDNEERSADWAERALTAAAQPSSAVAEVKRLILLTKGHRVGPGDLIGAWMVSIDLAILGANWADYSTYANDVRREYGHVTDTAWRHGRAAVLEHLLAADPLFAEPSHRARLELSARANLRRELNSLRAD